MDGQTTWIQCCKSPCGKWRIVREDVAKKFENLAWSCEMNENRLYSKCSAAEEDVAIPKGKKVVLTKLPFKNGEIIMAKLSGFCSWPALICPDPYCDLYYDAVLNEKNEEDEITHIHVEFFGWPKSHSWVLSRNISPFSGTKPIQIIVKNKKAYQVAMEEASKALSLSCEERLKNCTFKTILDLSKRNNKGSLKRERNTTKKNIFSNEKDFLERYHKFMTERGSSRIKPQIWNGKMISLYKIFQSVHTCGGYNEVSRKGKWISLRDELFNKENPSVKPSRNLKLFYTRHMLDFEEYLKTINGKGVRFKRSRSSEGETFLTVKSINESNDNDLNQSTDLVSDESYNDPNSLKRHDNDIYNRTILSTHKSSCLSESSSDHQVVDIELDSSFDCNLYASLNNECYSTTTSHKYILGDDFVPSSNPDSPQVLPREEDLDDDCGTSIKRELEEMERLLENIDSASEGQPLDSKITHNQDLLTNNNSSPVKDEIKDAIRDILEIEQPDATSTAVKERPESLQPDKHLFTPESKAAAESKPE